VGGPAKQGESELDDKCHQTPDKEDPSPKLTQAEDPSPKSTQAEEEQEFFDIVGKEHVERRAKPPDDVRSILERIKARNKAS
jgi:hypothetical protein